MKINEKCVEKMLYSVGGSAIFVTDKIEGNSLIRSDFNKIYYFDKKKYIAFCFKYF